MSDVTLTDPHVRVAQNYWYLYFDRNPKHGPDGCVTAVIEEVCDEIWSGDGGPTRHYRQVFLHARTVESSPRPPVAAHCADYDGLDWHIENEMSDEEFQQLVADGTIIPIKAPQPPAAS